MLTGGIEIQLFANLARLQRDMDQARNTVSGAMAHIERYANAAKAALGAIAGGLSAGAFASWIKGAIDAVDSLTDLSTRTQIAVEDLAGLSYAAQLSGSTLDGIAGSISKLSTNIGKDAEKFRALGVTASDPLEAYKQLADIFKSIQDPQQRAAFGAEALGKSWQEAAVLLNEGSAGIDALIKRGQDLSGVTTQISADAAAFNDKLDELGGVANGVGQRIAAGLLPMLNQLAEGMVNTSNGAQSTGAVISEYLVEAMRALIVLGGNVAYVLKTIGTEIGGLVAQVVAYYTAVFKFFTFDFKGAAAELRSAFGEGGIGDQMKADAAASRAAFDKWEQSWLNVGKVAKQVQDEIEPFPDPFGIDAAIEAENAAKVAAFLKSSEVSAARKKAADEADAAAKKEREAYASLIGPLREKAAANEYEIRTGHAMTESQKAIVKLDEALKSGKLALAPAHEAEVRATIASVEAQDKWLSAAKQTKEAVQTLTEERAASYAAAVAEAQVSEQQVAEFGKTKAQIEALTIARLEDRVAQRASLDLSEEDVAHTEKLLAAKKRNAAALSKLDVLGSGTDVAKATELLKIMEAVDEAAKQAASGMEASFGRVGAAIGGLTTALTGYSRTQAAIAAQLAAATKDAGGDQSKVQRANAVAAAAAAQAQVKSYGDMARAAKGFFKENTAGYKVLEGTEKAFRAYEMAMALQAMVKKIFFKETEVGANMALNATKLAGEATTTAASTTLAGTEASAWGVTAVVKAIASMPFPLNLAAGAVTLAAVLALGAKVTGGLGGGGDTTAKDRQAAAGTGSVLGDESAKSESIAKAIENLEKYASIDLSHTQGMLAALISIRDNIGAVAALVSQTAGLRATAIDEKKYGVGSSSGFLGIGASSTSIIDSGIKLNASQSVGAAIAAGVEAMGYADVQTKKSGLWGLGSSTKTNRNSIDLDEDLKKQLSLILGSMRDGAVEAVKLLGMSADGVVDKVNQMAIGVNEISFKGLTGGEIQKELEAVFSKIGDDIAKAAAPELSQFQKVGEGYLETLTRVATDYATLDSIFAASGRTFGMVGLASIEARERLILMAGGLDKLAEQSQFFNENYLSEAERLAPVQAYVTEQMTAMGRAAVTTRDQFKDVLLGLDVTTEAGARQYAAMLKLAPQFKQMTDYTEASAAKLVEANKPFFDTLHEMDRAMMSAAELRADDIKDMDASTIALYDLVAARKTENAAVEDAADAVRVRNAEWVQSQNEAYTAGQAIAQQRAQAQQQLAERRATMETTLYNLTHTAAEQTARARQAELAAIDATLRPLQAQIYAQQDLASAATAAANEIEAAAARAKAVASERAGIERSMMQLQGDTAGLRKLELAALDPANRALQESYFALQDKMAADAAAAQMAQMMAEAQARAAEESKRAAEALKAAWKGATDSIFDEVARIRGLISGGGASSLTGAQSAFAIATAQARAGDQDAAKLLPGLSRSVLELAEANSVTLLDLRRIQAMTASSLMGTGAGLASQFGLQVPSYDVGTDYVPRTGLALIHEGEKITPAAYNRPFTPDSGGITSAEVLAELRALRAEVASFHQDNSTENRGIARDGKRLADGVEMVTDGFDAMRTKEEA